MADILTLNGSILTSNGSALTSPTSAGVTSVNGKTGAVILSASDINALPSTAGVVKYDEALSLTDNEKSQARANIQAGASNRNLLDNSWFTVNQRGASGAVASGGYAADRWFVGGDSITRNADGTITLDGTSSYAALTQRLEESLINFLVGKTVTMSLLYADGTVYSGTVDVDANRENVVYINGTTNFFVLDTRASRRWYIYLNGLEKTLTAVKLELGSYSTLANDVPPDYGTELAKCQRYFQRLHAASSTAAPLGLTEYASTSLVKCTVILPVPLRANPTVTLSGNVSVSRKTGWVANISTFAFLIMADNRVTFNATVSGLAEASDYLVYLANNAYLDLSADL